MQKHSTCHLDIEKSLHCYLASHQSVPWRAFHLRKIHGHPQIVGLPSSPQHTESDQHLISSNMPNKWGWTNQSQHGDSPAISMTSDRHRWGFISCTNTIITTSLTQNWVDLTLHPHTHDTSYYMTADHHSGQLSCRKMCHAYDTSSYTTADKWQLTITQVSCHLSALKLFIHLKIYLHTHPIILQQSIHSYSRITWSADPW